MGENEMSGATSSSGSTEMFFITNSKPEEETFEIIQSAFILRGEDMENEEFLKENLVDDEVKNQIDKIPELKEYLEDGNLVVPKQKMDDEEFKEYEAGVEAKIENLEDEEKKGIAFSILNKIREIGGKVLKFGLLALGLFIGYKSIPKDVIESKSKEFSNGMPSTLDYIRLINQDLLPTGSTQSANFYYSGGTQSNPNL